MDNLSPLPSFERAEYIDTAPRPDECAFCQRGALTEYYRVDGLLACSQCASQAQSLVPRDSHKAFSKALLYGSVVAVLCCVGYSIMELKGFMIGYVAIGVGWAVAKAMRKGSGGRGGRRYQWVAILLTYAAISVAFMPAVLVGINKATEQKRAAATQNAPAAGTTSATGSAETAKKPMTFGSFAAFVLLIIAIGLFSPFIKFFVGIGTGLLGLLFLGIGMQTAWRLTQKTAAVIEGPYEANVTPAAAL